MSKIADGSELGLSPRAWQRSEAERCLAGATVVRSTGPSHLKEKGYLRAAVTAMFLAMPPNTTAWNGATAAQ